MKILYINALYDPYIRGGAEISLQVLVEGMRNAGHEVAVLSLKPEGRLSVEEINGVKVYRTALQNVYWPFAKVKPAKPLRLLWHVKDRYNAAMRKVVDQVLLLEKPDLVSCHNLVGWSVAVWEAVHHSGIPFVQVLHDLYLLCANSDMFKNGNSCEQQCFRCSVLRGLHKKKSNMVNAVVGISHFILDRFNHFHYFSNAQHYVIYNSRNIPNTPHPQPRTPGQALRVGYLGTLATKKGIEWLIKQFNTLTTPAYLIIAGNGEKQYEEKLRASVTNPAISFIGYTDPTTFYSMIDVLVVPSLWQEPLGMVAIEALANHVPVIANKVGGLKETVQDGYNGLWCDDQDPDSLAKAISTMALDFTLYNDLVKQARKSVEQILSKERMIKAYVSVYKALQNNKHERSIS